jgi:protein-S-isoprenylcysteine O-methyltransferase Ste14
MKNIDRLWVLGQWTLVIAFALTLIFVAPPAKRLLPAWLGIILCALGPIIVAFAVIAFQKVNKIPKIKVGPLPNPAFQLVEYGIYGYIRHPMYLAAGLLILGAAIWRGGLAAYGFVVVSWLFLFFKIRFEEKMLQQTYPDYAAYMKRTGRILPRLSGSPMLD